MNPLARDTVTLYMRHVDSATRKDVWTRCVLTPVIWTQKTVRSIGNDGAGVVPATMSIDFIKAETRGATINFLDSIKYWEQKQSLAILGGTLTSQPDGKTSTNALGTIHDKVRREIMLHDARQIAPSIQRQVVQPLALINGMFP